MNDVNVNLGGDVCINPIAIMQTNLNGPWVVPRETAGADQTPILQTLLRHKHLGLALKRFNVSLLGIEEHHLPCPLAHVAKDVVTDKLQKVFPSRWHVLANPSFSERSGVALAWRKDMWTMLASFTPLRG